MKEVPIHRVGLFQGSLHRDAMSVGVGNHFGPAGELITKALLSPRGDDIHLGCQTRGAELEPDLIVPFPGRPMGDGIGLLGERHIEHTLRDTGARDRGAEEIASLVNRICLEHGEDIVPGKCFPEIADKAFAGSRIEGFFLKAV